ncbi:MAG: hypothetical protein AVDCRST_MAG70-182 [uncultured Thermomicrobiales bacterium]|uniref:Uncharacterized protein n=1 Tax=uncultured Thermomicrobiales bacterium TaxID=1645740 RepID=A0A6J4U8Z4_9BACT|nr:MAG: hypothetical protein AVDCRST_MAG70-182 [uncultured Thermomicrobiales bacterium]
MVVIAPRRPSHTRPIPPIGPVPDIVLARNVMVSMRHPGHPAQDGDPVPSGALAGGDEQTDGVGLESPEGRPPVDEIGKRRSPSVH